MLCDDTSDTLDCSRGECGWNKFGPKRAGGWDWTKHCKRHKMEFRMAQGVGFEPARTNSCLGPISTVDLLGLRALLWLVHVLFLMKWDGSILGTSSLSKCLS